jgi:hypothetical protein
MPVNNTTQKKIVTHKAPTEKASTYDEGYTMDGSDGVTYIVNADENVAKRWIKNPNEPEKVVAPE